MAYRSFEFEIISSDGKKQILSIELLCIKIPTYGERTFLKGHIDYVATLDVSSFYVKEKDKGNNTYFAMCNLNDDKDLKIVRQEGNELVEFFDFELLTKLVCLFDSQKNG